MTSGIKVYDANDLYFAYPENWTLEESDMETAAGAVQLANDDGAFWLLKKYPFGTNPDEIAREAVDAMRSEYQDMEVDRVDLFLFEKSVTGFEMTFFHLDLMNTATVLCYEEAGTTYAVFWQTGNQLIVRADEAIPTEKVLEAITFSLLKGAEEPDSVV